MSIFGVLSLIAGFATLMLPETYGENLPETMQEAESFGRWVSEAGGGGGVFGRIFLGETLRYRDSVLSTEVWKTLWYGDSVLSIVFCAPSAHFKPFDFFWGGGGVGDLS